MTIRQHAIQSALQDSSSSRSPSPEPLTHVQEQKALQQETIAAFHGGDDDADDDFLIPREKTKDELEREEEEYKAFLEREVGEDLRGLVTIDDEDGVIGVVGGEELEAQEESGKKDKKKKKKDKKEKGKAKEDRKSKAEEDQEFLMKYVLSIAISLIFFANSSLRSQLHPQQRLD